MVECLPTFLLSQTNSSAFRAAVALGGLASCQHNTTKKAKNWIGQRQGPPRPELGKISIFSPSLLLGLLVAEASVDVSQLVLAKLGFPLEALLEIRQSMLIS